MARPLVLRYERIGQVDADDMTKPESMPGLKTGSAAGADFEDAQISVPVMGRRYSSTAL